MTLIDPQFEMIRVLQPFNNFEAVYQGADGGVPIAFPGILDDLAGETGYATNLGAGAAMPAKGTRIKIWFPQVVHSTGESFTVNYNYAFELKWRLRNYKQYFDQAAAGTPGAAVPYSIKGSPDGYATSGNNRIFIPGGADVLLYEQTEPVTDGAPGTINIRTQRYIPMIETPALPLAPGGSNLVWQQGVYEGGGTVAETSGVTYSVLDVETQGDELAIWVYKVEDEDWDFTSTDEDFTYVFGNNNGARTTVNPNLGILITTGVAGS